MKHSYAEYALLFKALSDETRLKIVNMLSGVELCACSILEEFNITQPTLSYHMKILMECELVKGRKAGSWMMYTLNIEKTRSMIDLLNEANVTKSVPENQNEKCNNKIRKEEVIMSKLEIFDPAMCCSTGVCGPSIDPELLRIATVINSSKEKGIDVMRHNLSSEPQDFISNKVIGEILQKEGADILPVTLLDGEVVKTKEYPTNEEFSKWLNIEIETKQNSDNNNDGDCCSGKCCC